MCKIGKFCQFHYSQTKIDIKNFYAKFLDIDPRNYYAKPQSLTPPGFHRNVPFIPRKVMTIITGVVNLNFDRRISQE